MWTIVKPRTRHGVMFIALLAIVACSPAADEQDGVADTAEATNDTTQATNGDGDDGEGQNGPAGAEDTPAGAEDTTGAFYEGETIEWIVTSGPGGGSDTMARFLASWLPQCTEGDPNVQVVNIEGAGGVVGSNEFALSRDPDGLSIMSTGPSSTLNFLLQHPEAEYDLREMYPVFGISDEDGVYVSPDTGVESPGDLSNPAEALVIGAQAPQSTDSLLLIAWEVLGISPEVVFGYEGRGETRLAFERGEVNMDAQSIGPYRQFVEPLIEAGEAVPLLATGVPVSGEVERGPGFPDLPTVREVHEEMHGEAPSGSAWDGYKAVLSGVVGLPRAVWLHGEAPDEAKEALREAFVCMSEDEEFMEEVVDLLGSEPIVGDDIDPAVEGLLNVDQEALDWVIGFLVEEYGAERE